jgi:sulfite reductase (NADPH) flavoprotein alpha-component
LNGPAWLFFGERQFRTDFLYQTEWQAWLKGGILSRIDLAFSRDQAEKIYVQHRMAEQARELYAWLQDGAHLYVCGDATAMAPDVEAALTSIVKEQGACSAEQAAEYIHSLHAAGRYHRDVY